MKNIRVYHIGICFNIILNFKLIKMKERIYLLLTFFLLCVVVWMIFSIDHSKFTSLSILAFFLSFASTVLVWRVKEIDSDNVLLLDSVSFMFLFSAFIVGEVNMKICAILILSMLFGALLLRAVFVKKERPIWLSLIYMFIIVSAMALNEYLKMN